MATDVKTVDKKTEADVKTDDKETEEPAPVASILELDRSPEATEAGAKLALQLAQADDEDVEKIKAHTMHKMVEEFTDGTKCLFLTRKQAELITKDELAIARMLAQGFDIPEPKLVINLLTSTGYNGEEKKGASMSHRREQLDQFMS